MKCGEIRTQHAGEEKGSDGNSLIWVPGLLGTGLALGCPLSGALLRKTLPWPQRRRPSGQGLPCQGLSALLGLGWVLTHSCASGQTARLAAPQHKRRPWGGATRPMQEAELHLRHRGDQGP